MKKKVFSLLVDNQAGVLSRIAGLFSRRGYNIDSLTVGETEDPAFSRMTIVTSGEEDVLEQIEKQLGKLIDVASIRVLPAESSVARELILIKVNATAADRQEVIAVADIFRAKIVDVSETSLMIELTGNQNKLEAFIGLLGRHRIRQLARTGITGLSRGSFDEAEGSGNAAQ